MINRFEEYREWDKLYGGIQSKESRLHALSPSGLWIFRNNCTKIIIQRLVAI